MEIVCGKGWIGGAENISFAPKELAEKLLEWAKVHSPSTRIDMRELLSVAGISFEDANEAPS